MQIPMLAWQIALLSGDSKLASQARARVPQVYEKIDFTRVHSGWTFNYAVVLGLLDLAAQGERRSSAKIGTN